MSALATIEQQLKSWPQPMVEDHSNIVVVPTQFLYPSMNVVKTFIEYGNNEVRVSDGGGALREISEIGSFQFDVLKILTSKAKPWDLTVTNDGWIKSSAVPVEKVADMVAWVATASHNLATMLLDKIMTRPKAGDFRQELETFLGKHYATRLRRNRTFVGASNKKHKFDYFLTVNGEDKGILIDAVLNDGSSINSAVVSHMDVASTELEGIEQRIVYDDRDEWKSSDLSLLRVGATPLAFTNLDVTLARALERI